MDYMVVGEIRYAMQFKQTRSGDSLASYGTVVSVPDILVPYHRSLTMHAELVEILRSHQVTFEVSRQAIAQWVAQPHLEDGSWEAQWEDLCAVEIERWNSPK